MKKLLSFIFKNLDSLILSIGGLLIVVRVFYPPKYYVVRGIRFPYDGTRGFAPISDFETAILHSIGIAVITGVLFYFTKKISRIDIHVNNKPSTKIKNKVDEKVGFIIKPQFYAVSNFSEGLAAVAIRKPIFLKFGFIDRFGEVIIPLQFDSAGDFHEGLATVKLNGKWGYINKTGEIAIKPVFDSVGSFSKGLAAIELNGKRGYINKTGEITNNPVFDSIDHSPSADKFSEGLAAVEVNGKWGYINKSGEITINPVFDSIDHFPGAAGFSEGLAAVMLNGKWGYIDKQGELIIKPQFDTTQTIWSAYLDEKGKLKTKPTSQCYAYGFSNGFAIVKVNNKFGCIDKSGNYVFKPIFKSANDFHEGLAAVKLKSKWGFIGQLNT